jgi:hypothetical protein
MDVGEKTIIERVICGNGRISLSHGIFRLGRFFDMASE